MNLFDMQIKIKIMVEINIIVDGALYHYSPRTGDPNKFSTQKHMKASDFELSYKTERVSL
jgi:hypothetical protein